MHRPICLSIAFCISMLLLFSCQKDDDVNTDEEEETTINDSTDVNGPELVFFLKAATNSGDSILMNVFDIDTFDTYEIKGYASDIPNADSCLLSYTYGFTKVPILDAANLPDDIFLFSFLRFFSSPTTDCQNASENQAFPDLFTPRSLPFSNSISEKGVALLYKDKDGNEWTSILGDQSSSAFEITAVSKFEDPGISGVRMRVEGNFNAMLYSADSSQAAIEITAAEYKVLVINAFN